MNKAMVFSPIRIGKPVESVTFGFPGIPVMVDKFSIADGLLHLMFERSLDDLDATRMFSATVSLRRVGKKASCYPLVGTESYLYYTLKTAFNSLRGHHDFLVAPDGFNSWVKRKVCRDEAFFKRFIGENVKCPSKRIVEILSTTGGYYIREAETMRRSRQRLLAVYHGDISTSPHEVLRERGVVTFQIINLRATK